jgi:ElaB/YqjD/DUF883 family membrane-anchored ribosome-binding protein
MTKQELQEKISSIENDEIREILNEIVVLDTEKLKEKKDEIVGELEDIVKKYPLLSILVAAVIGFIIGRISK